MSESPESKLEFVQLLTQLFANIPAPPVLPEPETDEDDDEDTEEYLEDDTADEWDGSDDDEEEVSECDCEDCLRLRQQELEEASYDGDAPDYEVKLNSIPAVPSPQASSIMSNATLQVETVHQVDIVRHGQALLIPETMSLKDAVEAIKRQIDFEDQIITFSDTVKSYPVEALLAFKWAMTEFFGTCTMKPIKTPLGEKPPTEFVAEVGLNQLANLSWGAYVLPCDPDNQGLITNVDFQDGRPVFVISGKFRRKWLTTVNRVMELTRLRIESHSIYRGQALRIEGPSDPKFIDVSRITPADLVYSRELTDIIEANVFAPIRNSDACREAGIPLKRGVLAAGPYGTGKSLLAYAVAHEAVKHGWTFFYVREADSLPAMIKLAQQYQPAVLFAEDIDQQVSGGRDHEMNEILNTLDGIDNKNQELLVVFTTNHLENINAAMLRPGRLDVILNILPPDAEACERLVRRYAVKYLDPAATLTEAGKALAGYTPAIIREVVERSKLVTISRTGMLTKLSEQDILIAAASMREQQKLITKPAAEAPSWSSLMVAEITERVKGHKTEELITELHERFIGS
jgi:transitional endoplasmic reticulum ATPase